MAIPESQLETWSHQGSVAQSADTYNTFRTALNDNTSPFYMKDYSIFLQGSYGNDTNVFRDSDVDIVIRLNQTYYANTDELSSGAKENYDRSFSLATYQHANFKADVQAWLQKKFGSDVSSCEKAIFIKGRNNRRNTDVLVCAKHRRYRTGSTGADNQFDEGIVFWTNTGAEIVNFPEHHSKNCTVKHQATNNRFKKIVRVYKNMRNRMIDDHYIAEGIAPSYFIEGMLWNVPPEYFVQSHSDSFINTFNWIANTDKTKLACASDLHWLVRDNKNVCWPTANFDAYLATARNYWNSWPI